MIDTPITRASIEQLPADQLNALVAELREKRLKQQRIFEAGLLAKKEAKDAKDAAMLDKRLEQFIKKAETADKAIEALHKIAIEIQALRLALGYEI